MAGPSEPGGHRSLLGELKRRRVFRVLAVYAVVAFVVLQVADLTFSPLQLPPWALTLVVVLAILGFPVAAVLAWAFEATPEGIRPTQGGSGGGLRGTWLLALVLVAVTVGAGAGAWLWLGRGAFPWSQKPGAAPPEARRSATPAVPAPGSSADKTIAVLPFENLSPDPDNAFFAGAMTEELTSALSRVPGLSVVSRTSASRFADTKESVPEIGHQLGVAYVLEGSVRRAEGRVAIVVQLIDTKTDEHVWTDRYEREMKDVLHLQVEIAGHIADELRSSFTQAERRRIEAGNTNDPAAYDLYLRGREILFGANQTSQLPEAIDLFRRAVERDPEYANAWFGLGVSYGFSPSRLGPSARDSARVALDRAVQFTKEPSRKVAFEAVRALMLGEDPTAATEELRRAVDANPGDAYLVFMFTQVTWNQGDLVTAIRWGLRARDLDPLNADRWAILGDAFRQLGLDSEALSTLSRALQLDRSNVIAWYALYWFRFNRGEENEALATVDSASASLALDSLNASTLRAVAYLRMGEAARARAILEKTLAGASWEAFWFVTPELVTSRRLVGDTAGNGGLIRRAEETARRSPPLQNINYIKLQLAAARGDAPGATEGLRSYVEHGGKEARQVATDPVLEPVRSDPAFQAELRKLQDRVERDRREVLRMLETPGS